MKFCFVFGLEPWLLPPALEMCAALKAKDHEVSVLYCEFQGWHPEEGDMDMAPAGVVPKAKGLKHALRPYRLGRMAREYVSRQSPDVLICCDPLALQAISMFSLQRQITSGYWGFETVQGPSSYRLSLDYLRALMFPGWIRSLDFFLAPSESRAQRIIERCQSKLQYEVIYNCKALAEPCPPPERIERLQKTTKEFKMKLVYTGRISPTQYLATILESLALLPSDTALFIAGIGHTPFLTELEELSIKLEVERRVFFLGRLSRQESYALLDMVDIGFVFYDEKVGAGAEDPAPNKIGDYVASNVFMVGSKQAYISHWLEEHHTGLCLEEVNPKTIAEAVRQLADSGRLKDPSPLKQVFEKELNMNRQADKLINLISRSKKPHP